MSVHWDQATRSRVEREAIKAKARELAELRTPLSRQERRALGARAAKGDQSSIKSLKPPIRSWSKLPRHEAAVDKVLGSLGPHSAEWLDLAARSDWRGLAASIASVSGLDVSASLLLLHVALDRFHRNPSPTTASNGAGGDRVESTIEGDRPALPVDSQSPIETGFPGTTPAEVCPTTEASGSLSTVVRPNGASAVPSFVQKVERTLRSGLELARDAHAAIAAARLADAQVVIEDYAARLRDVESALAEAESEPGRKKPLPRPDWSNLSDASVEAYLTQLQRTETENQRARHEAVESARTTYRNELHVVGLSVPDDLADALTPEAVEVIRSRDAGRYAFARFLRELEVDGHPSSAALALLPPGQRLIAYMRAAAQGAAPERILSWLTADMETREADPNAAAEMLATAAERALLAGDAIPSGLWTLAIRLDEGALLERLRRQDVEAQLCNAPEGLTRIVELVALDGKQQQLNIKLSHRLSALRYRSLPANARVRELAQIPAEDPLILRELLAALTESNRWADIFALYHSLRIQDNSVIQFDEIRTQFLAFLVDRTITTGPHHDILSAFVHDDAWCDDDNDSWTCLLFLASALGLGTEQTYIHRPEVRSVVQQRPALMHYWLIPQLEGREPPPACKQMLERWNSARESFKLWTTNLQKTTCYQAWRYAEDYQRGIRAFLEKLQLSLIKTATFTPVQVDALLKSVRAAQNLPEVNEPVRGLITTYVQSQIFRLTELQSAMRALHATWDEIARYPSAPWRDLLQQESRLPHNAAPAMQLLYTHAVNSCLSPA